LEIGEWTKKETGEEGTGTEEGSSVAGMQLHAGINGYIASQPYADAGFVLRWAEEISGQRSPMESLCN
jgi:hypothetical protein